MLRNYYINKEFIVSRTARGVYRAAASLSLGMFFLLVALKMTGRVPEGLLPVVRLFVFAGVVGTALTMVAMEYFLFAFDTSSTLQKAFWFCFMLMFPLLGAAVYCFSVYSNSDMTGGPHPPSVGECGRQ